MTSERVKGLVAVGAAVLGLSALTGCDKPVPKVSAVTDGVYAQAQATLYCFEGQADTGSGSCREGKPAPATLRTHAGAPVAVEVPQEVRDRGWFVRLVGSGGQILPGPIQRNSSYFRLTADFSDSARLSIQVVAMPEGGRAAAAGEPSGVWEFTLINADAS